MNKTCARCEKTVYPTEELKCLDKVWHKGCFKCQECGMTLNMRTYKGYGKLPYCESHVPKAKHTTMAETPELKRIAENTKIQSNVMYHADFEKSKGKFTQVADDPETLRIKANTRIISNVAYHGDLEKKAHMEKRRQMTEDGEIVDVPTDYHQQIDTYTSEMLPPPHLPPKNHYQTPVTQYQAYQPTAYTQSANHNYNHQGHQNVQTHQSAGHQNVQSHQIPHQSVPNSNAHSHSTNHQNLIPPPQSYSNQNMASNMSVPSHQNVTHNVQSHQNAAHNVQSHQNAAHNVQSHQTAAHNVQGHQNVAHNVAHQNRQYQEQYYQNQKRDDYQTQKDFIQREQYQYQDYNYGQQQKIGRIQDYDPVSDGPRAPPNTQRASATLIYNSTSDKRGAHQSSQSSQQTRQIGRVTELDPLANEVPPTGRHHTQTNQNLYIAMYDYEANDSDEVSFREGDMISNVSAIDSGWMTGQVVRTGRAGMLPANYVQLYDHTQQY